MRRHASGRGSTAGIRYIVFLTAFLLQGCYTLNGTVPFKYVPSLSSGDSIEMRAGMERLADKRPSDDKSSTENIDDVSDKVTAKLLEDFRASQLFTGLDLPPQKGKNDLILRGDIKRFYWKATPSPIAFIPIVNLAAYFGAPVTFIEEYEVRAGRRDLREDGNARRFVHDLPPDGRGGRRGTGRGLSRCREAT